MFDSGREALPDVWEWSGGPPGCLGVDGGPSRMSGSGPDTPRMSGRNSRMSGSGRKAIPDVQ